MFINSSNNLYIPIIIKRIHEPNEFPHSKSSVSSFLYIIVSHDILGQNRVSSRTVPQSCTGSCSHTIRISWTKPGKVVPTPCIPCRVLRNPARHLKSLVFWYVFDDVEHISAEISGSMLMSRNKRLSNRTPESTQTDAIFYDWNAEVPQVFSSLLWSKRQMKNLQRVWGYLGKEVRTIMERESIHLMQEWWYCEIFAGYHFDFSIANKRFEPLYYFIRYIYFFYCLCNFL